MPSPSPNKTIGDLVKFVLRNRKDHDFFTGYSIRAIAAELVESAKVNGLRYVCDNEGRVSALVVSFPWKDGRLHINQIWCSRYGDMRKLVQAYYDTFPDKPITALRAGKRIDYTNSAIRKLHYGRQ